MDQFKERNAFVKSDALNDYDDLNTRQRNWSLENYDLSTWGNSKAKYTPAEKQEKREVAQNRQTSDEQIVIKLKKPSFEKSITNACCETATEDDCVELTPIEQMKINCGCTCDDEILATHCSEEKCDTYDEFDHNTICNEKTDYSDLDTTSCETEEDCETVIETSIEPKPVFSSTQNMLSHFMSQSKCEKCARPCKMYYMTANNQYNVNAQNITAVQNSISTDNFELIENQLCKKNQVENNSTQINVMDDVDNKSGYEDQIIEI